MKFFYHFTATCFALFFRLFYGHKVYGREHIPEGGGIIAANHASFFDPPLIAVSLKPEECYFLARSSLFDHFFFSKIISNLNAYPVSGTTHDLNSFKTISKLLKENKKVAIFPEGHRTVDSSLGEIKTGVAMLAIKTGCPIIPVYLHGTYQVWSRHMKFFKLSGKTACVFGPPLYPQSNSQMNKKAQQEELTQRLNNAIINLQKWYLNEAQCSTKT
ncbi:MAG: lysophospholipid acyltransferase family protein [Parachlamydiaceae bacterium]